MFAGIKGIPPDEINESVNGHFIHLFNAFVSEIYFLVNPLEKMQPRDSSRMELIFSRLNQIAITDGLFNVYKIIGY